MLEPTLEPNGEPTLRCRRFTTPENSHELKTCTVRDPSREARRAAASSRQRKAQKKELLTASMETFSIKAGNLKTRNRLCGQKLRIFCFIEQLQLRPNEQTFHKRTRTAATVLREPTEGNLVHLLNKWCAGWKHTKIRLELSGAMKSATPWVCTFTEASLEFPKFLTMKRRARPSTIF